MPSKPPLYRPGDGPALAPITLALKNDSDAFIVDKRVQPGKPVHGEVRLEMYYLVGWPDLPAGRVLINARNIYDYVSPRTLEDFEYKLSLAREEEEERIQEAEKAKRKAEAVAKAQAVAAAAAAAPPTSSASATPKIRTPRTEKVPTLATSGKKRGRPSKADLLARQMAQQTSVGENVEIPLPSTSTSGPSLSTPQKKKLAAVIAAVSEVDTDDQETEEEEEEEEADPGDAIFQQLYSEASAVNTAEEAKDAKPSKKEIPLRTAPRPQSPHKPANGKPRHSTPSQPRLLFHTNQDHSPSGSKTAPVQKSTLQHYGFTPAGRSSGKWPSLGTEPKLSNSNNNTNTKRTKPNSSTTTPTPATITTTTSAVETPTSSKSGKKPPPRKRKRTTSTPNQEPLWEVKRLEGDRVEEASDGTRTRFFHVRWKGHWPADQNPTWEPEENIPRKLIKEYLRHKSSSSNSNSSKGGGSSIRNSPFPAVVASVETGHAHTPSSSRRVKKNNNRQPALPVRKYSSVSEVFEGAVEEEEPSRGSGSARGGGRVDMLSYGDDGDGDGDDDDDDDDDYEDEGVDQLVVTEQPHPPRPQRRQQPDQHHQRQQQQPGGFASPSSSTPALSLSSLLRTQFDADTLSRELSASFGGPAVGRRLSQHQQQHRPQPQRQQKHLHGESPDDP